MLWNFVSDYVKGAIWCHIEGIQIYQFTRIVGSEEDVQFLILNYLELWKYILHCRSLLLAWFIHLMYFIHFYL